MRSAALLMLALLPVPPLLVAQQPPPRAQPVDPALLNDAGRDWFQHGRNLYESAKRTTGLARENSYERAIDIFSRYLNEFPNHGNAEAAWWYLGQSYYGIGRVDDAKRCFHSLLNRYGRGRYAAAAAYTLGADHFNSRNYALAATLFEKLSGIADTPSDRQRGLFYAGRSYQLQGRADRAIHAYRRLLTDPAETNPYLSKGRVEIGTLLAQDGKLDEALEEFLKVVNSPSAPEIRGRAALEGGSVAARLERTELSDELLNLVLTTPGMTEYRPDAQIALMAARFDQQRYRDVIRIFNQSSNPGEGEREARRLMLAARSFMMLDRNADALPLFRSIERLVPKTSPLAFDATYFRLLCFYRIEGRYVLDQVEAFLELYRKSNPRDAKIHTALLMKAETLYAEGQPKEAAAAYRDIDPTLLSEANRKGFLYQRGRCLADSGDAEGAIQSLGDFIAKYPEDDRIPVALAARGESFATLGNRTAALADFERLIDSTDDEPLLTLAYLEAANLSKDEGNLENMIARYRTFLERLPNAAPRATAKANYWAGWGLVKLNRADEAIDLLRRARDLAPDLYAKHAGLLLCLSYLADEEPAKLAEEIDQAIAENYVGDLPDQVIRWAADQTYNAGSYTQAARFYDLLAEDENPELAPTEVWRFLGKARIEAGDPAGALIAIDHALAAEQEPAWRADSLTDRGRALFALKRYDEATEAVEQGLELRPEGRVGANLHLLRGDILLAQGNPDEAVQSYILPVQLMADTDRAVRPRALHKLIGALEQAGKSADAAQYRKELADTYPGWSPDPAAPDAE